MRLMIVISAAAIVAILHSILPDHWLPIAMVARANRWSLRRTARTSLWAASGHVLASLAIGAVLIAAGTGVKSLASIQAHAVGTILILTGLVFLVWAVWRRQRRISHHHDHPDGRNPHHGDHPHVHLHTHSDPMGASSGEAGSRAGATPKGGWAASLAVPFGVAASPDLTILPVFLAAGTISLGASIAVVIVFSLATLITFVGLTIAAAAGGYRVQWPWLEENADLVSSAVLVVLGAAAYLAL